MKLKRGIVVNNNHPDKNGQCKVKLFGVHASNPDGDEFNKVSDDGLAWAEVMGSTEFGLNSGVGCSTVLRQGTMVWVMLEDNDPNKPIIMGVATGVPTKSSQGDTTGFADPDGVFPREDRLGEPDTHPEMRSNEAYTETAVIETAAGHILTSDPGLLKIYHNSGSIIQITSEGKITINSVNDIDVIATGKINMESGDTFDITAGGDFTVTAPNINLN